MLRILFYILIISFGCFLSNRGYVNKKIQNKTSHLQTASLFLLLGTMGYKIGSDQEIIKNFHTIGLQSFIISAFSIFFSILVTYFLFSFFQKKVK